MILIKFIWFIIYFSGNGIGADGAETIASNFKFLNNLKEFDLNL